MSQTGYYGDFLSRHDEEEEYNKQQEQQEPEIVMCCGCGDPMYRDHYDLKRNYCVDCRVLKLHHVKDAKKRHNK